MKRNCLGCGAEIPEGSQFCTVCGKEAPAGIPAGAPAPAPMPAPNYQAPVQENNNKPISFGAYLGMIILFCLPCIGFIANIIMCFAPKNKAIKTFAGSFLVAMIILCVIGAILGALFAGVIFMAIGEIVEEAGINFGQLLKDNGVNIEDFNFENSDTNFGITDDGFSYSDDDITFDGSFENSIAA